MRRRQGPLTRLTSPLIGLAAEALASRNSPSPAPVQHAPPNQQQYAPEYRQTSGNPPAYEDEDGYSSDELEDVLDLDEAGGTISPHRPPPPAGNMAGPAAVNTLISAFVQQNPPNLNYRGGRLQLPVILPQRRPENKSRGFVRAYAPMLMNCNINQDPFLQFLDYFDEAIKVTPVFDVINIAAAVSGFVPLATAQIVSTAATIIDMTAKEVYTRNRTNSFLDKINEAFWMPNGLYCMIMSYKPETQTVVERIDLNTLTANALAPVTSQMSGIRSKLNVSKGKTHGEINLPESAPLVFPALDTASAEQKKGFMPFVQDYFDRRSQANWAQQNPESRLIMNPQFASTYGDPTTAQGSGGLRGVLRSAIRGPDAGPTRRQERRVRRQDRRAERRAESGREPRQPRQPRQRGGPIHNLMKQDALYLMIVNLPTPAERREAETLVQG